jgi:hypothetical protein
MELGHRGGKQVKYAPTCRLTAIPKRCRAFYAYSHLTHLHHQGHMQTQHVRADDVVEVPHCHVLMSIRKRAARIPTAVLVQS